jgi:hypothetical protein
MTPKNIPILVSHKAASGRLFCMLMDLLALQKFYSILQAVALSEDIPDKFPDKTIPRYNQIHKVR